MAGDAEKETAKQAELEHLARDAYAEAATEKAKREAAENVARQAQAKAAAERAKREIAEQAAHEALIQVSTNQSAREAAERTVQEAMAIAAAERATREGAEKTLHEASIRSAQDRSQREAALKTARDAAAAAAAEPRCPKMAKELPLRRTPERIPNELHGKPPNRGSSSLQLRQRKGCQLQRRALPEGCHAIQFFSRCTKSLSGNTCGHNWGKGSQLVSSSVDLRRRPALDVFCHLHRLDPLG